MDDDDLEKITKAYFDASTPNISIPRMGIRNATWEELSEDDRQMRRDAMRTALAAIESDEDIDDSVSSNPHRKVLFVLILICVILAGISSDYGFDHTGSGFALAAFITLLAAL